MGLRSLAVTFLFAFLSLGSRDSCSCWMVAPLHPRRPRATACGRLPSRPAGWPRERSSRTLGCSRVSCFALVAATPEWAVLPPDAIFSSMSLASVLYFAPLIFAPRFGLTLTYAKSGLPFLVLGGLYFYGMALAVSTNPNTDFIGSALAGQTTLGSWHSFVVADPPSGTTALWIWVATSAMDIFAGRYIYLDSLKSKTFAAHSLLAGLILGAPAGLFVHIATQYAFGTAGQGMGAELTLDDVEG